MNYCRLSFAWVLAGTTVLTGCLAAHGQQSSAGRRRKIEFSDPGGSAVTSNLNVIAHEKTAIQNPAENLKQPADLFGPGHSLQGIGAPLIPSSPPSSVNSKRLKELLEKRHEWLFLETEDYQSGLTAEEIFGIPEYGPNGEVKEKQSPLERYFERLSRGNIAATNRTRDDRPFGPGIRQNDGSGTELTGADHKAGALPQPDSPLEQLLRGNAKNSLFPENNNNKPKGFSDVFGREGE